MLPLRHGGFRVEHVGYHLVEDRRPVLHATPSESSTSDAFVRRCVLRSVLALGFCTLACGLMIPASGRAADVVADQPALPDRAAAGSRVAGNPEADYSYLLTPFKLASQPNLKQSVFGFAGRTNSGNLGDTFAFGVGAPQRIFYDNYIVGGSLSTGLFSIQQWSPDWRGGRTC